MSVRLNIRYPAMILLGVIALSGCHSSMNTHSRPDGEPIEWSLAVEGDCNLYAREIGRGPRVVVLHGGWGAEHSYMVDAVEPLSERFRFVLYDQRGSLRSPCAAESISVDRHIDDLEALRRELGEERLLLIAHSMGGYLAMAYAERYPDRVAALALIDAAPAVGNVKELTEDLVETTLGRWERPATQEELRRNGISEQLHRHLHPLTRGPIDSTPTAEQRALWHRITFAAINLSDVHRWKQLKGADAYSASAGAAAAASMPASWDFTPVLRALPVPVLVIHGDDDYLPLSLDERWVHGVDNVRFRVVRNAGHVAWIDQPEECVALLRSYLEERATRAPTGDR